MSGNNSDHYDYPPTGERLARVTTVLGATDAKQHILVPWSARIAAEYAVANLATIGALVKRNERDAAVDLIKSQSAEIRDRKRDAGSYVHDVVEKLILWAASPGSTGTDIVLPTLPPHLAEADYDDEPLPDVVEAMTDGFLNFVADFRPVFHAAEMPVYNQPLGVAGTLDIIATLPGLAVGRAGRLIPGRGVTPCIDVKTGKFIDVTWKEQLAAYRRMPECRPDRLDDTLHPTPASDCGAVLHLRPEHDRGYRLMLVAAGDDAAAWNRFRRAADLYFGRGADRTKPGKVCYPLRPDGTVRSPRITDLDGEGYGHALAPLRRAGIDDLEQLAALTPGQCLAIKGVGQKVLTGIEQMLADHGLSLSGAAPAMGEVA